MIRSLMIPVGIAMLFLAWGFAIFYTVGVKWPPDWYYGAVEDVPGKSEFSSFAGKRFSGSGPAEVQGRPPDAQHVMGRRVEGDPVQQPPAIPESPASGRSANDPGGGK